jgi:drug/metabolite transporter (DMT)-like permease
LSRVSPSPSTAAGPSQTVGSLAVVLGACLFAALGVLSRTSYDLGLSPYGFVTWRSGVAAIAMAALVAVMVMRGSRLVGWRSLAPRDRVALGVAALAGASLDVTMFLAFARVPVAVVLLCFYLFPALVAGGSALLGWERLDRTRTTALVVSLAGMVAVVAGGEGAGALAGLDPIGVLLALGSAVSQAVFVLVARRGYREVPTEQAMTVVLAVSATIATLLALAGGALDAVLLPFSNPNLLVLLLLTGVFAAGVPSFLFLAGIRWIGGVRAGILMLAQAPVGVALAAVFLGESVGPVQVLGGAAILAGALIIQRSSDPSPAPGPPN